jgi:hypothetical protein
MDGLDRFAGQFFMRIDFWPSLEEIEGRKGLLHNFVMATGLAMRPDLETFEYRTHILLESDPIRGRTVVRAEFSWL